MPTSWTGELAPSAWEADSVTSSACRNPGTRWLNGDCSRSRLARAIRTRSEASPAAIPRAPRSHAWVEAAAWSTSPSPAASKSARTAVNVASAASTIWRNPTSHAARSSALPGRWAAAPTAVPRAPEAGAMPASRASATTASRGWATAGGTTGMGSMRPPRQGRPVGRSDVPCGACVVVSPLWLRKEPVGDVALSESDHGFERMFDHR